MKILAFDTSATACSIAIQNGAEIRFLDSIAPMQQAKLILPEIQTLLADVSLNLHDLDAIAYGCGPGSFTGIRIANSVAQGIAFAIQKPVIRISSLAMLAQATYMEKSYSNILVSLDARMNQIYWASYVANSNGYVELSGEEKLCAPEAVLQPATASWYGVGDGWDKYSAQLATRLGFEPTYICTTELRLARALLTLAKVKFEQRQWVAVEDAAPCYLG